MAIRENENPQKLVSKTQKHEEDRKRYIEARSPEKTINKQSQISREEIRAFCGNETKDTEEVSLPPIHDVEADGDVVQEQLPAYPAHLFSCPLLLLAPHATSSDLSVVCQIERQRWESILQCLELVNLCSWLYAVQGS
jgi:hypothetical protein